jgi:hypothetical protein
MPSPRLTLNVIQRLQNHLMLTDVLLQKSPYKGHHLKLHAIQDEVLELLNLFGDERVIADQWHVYMVNFQERMLTKIGNVLGYKF